MTIEAQLVAAVERAVSAAVEKALAGLEEKLATMKPASGDGPAYLDTAQLGERFGITRRAMVQRLKTRPPLKALSRVVDGRRVWIAGDVDAYMRGGGK